MSVSWLTRSLLLPGLLLGLGCARSYIQNEGFYELRAVDVLRDDCGMLSSPEALWDGSLHMSGKVVHINYELLDMDLVGSFLGGDDDVFAVDGSVTNATVIANGQECLVDQITVHLDGVTQCATQFNGVLRVRYESRRQSSCGCELWTTFEAVQDASPCAATP